MRIQDWLAQNPAGPYRLTLATVPGDGDEEATAGYVSVVVDEVQVDDADGMVYFQRGDDAAAALVLAALGEGTVEGPAWVAAYGNLAVPVPGFHPQAMVVLQREGE